MIALKTKPFAHQEQAKNKLKSSKVGALFMEMGTGKSLVVLELIALRSAKIVNIVWFCPCSIKLSLAEEIKKHLVPGLESLIHVFDDKTSLDNIPFNRLHIVGIESVSSSNNTVFCLHKIITANTYVIVDESFYIKTPTAKRTLWINELTKNCLYKLILTGTPIAHSVIDLYAQMKFLSPKIFGYSSYYAFAKNHVEIVEEKFGYSKVARNTKYLAARLEPYVYQVTKEECLDLPQKIYQPHYFEMSLVQRHYYNIAKDELLFNTEVDDFSYRNILSLFTALQQIVCGFWNKNGVLDTFINNRLKILSDIINYIPADQKIIIWCKYHYDIQVISEFLKQNYDETDIALFYGKLTEKQKNQELSKFRKQSKFFLATTASGGHGLTLNESSYTVFYNNTFKYTDRVQAEDRNHRIGQTTSPNYIDIICRDSIDEKIELSFSQKSDVVNLFKKQVNQAQDGEQRKLLLESL